MSEMKVLVLGRVIFSNMANTSICEPLRHFCKRNVVLIREAGV